ncbi:class A beta-lactamase-related serine hydrolase [Lysobacter pythonis]|uniref:Class A beta-lactamase-related serine hydrolase n=2 Tax=Solilutibacter pythonis TaxID=2483112 RepID=A0A3M2HS68_9GAMM|nr:class A beta-lactamase-related serine hydrolase [Lysobacter pythonis]
MLLPVASVSPAQSNPHWPANQPQPPATPAVAQPGSPLDRYLQERQQQAPLYPQPGMTAPLPFDVHTFESLAQQLVANQRVPGLAVAIVQNGQVLSARGYGITDTVRPEPVDAHTVFRLASLSKSFAGTLAGMLVDEGTLAWQQPVTRYVPGFRLQNLDYTQRLSIANVLSQSTGLPRNAFDRDIEGNASYYDARAKLSRAPLRCGPGECYSYQNVAFSVFGDVVHAATGQLYDDNIQRRIFKPLGMNDASLGLEGIARSPRWAKPHVRGGAGWRPLMPKPTYYRLGPAAGINASIHDMAQYLVAQTGHRPDVLSTQVLSSIHTPLIDTPGEMNGSSWRRERLTAAGYGIGWRVYHYAGQPLYFHGGAVQGYRAAMALLPGRDLGVAILWNSESSLPSGLLPTILDSAIGLPQVSWLKLESIPGANAFEDMAEGASATGSSNPR